MRRVYGISASLYGDIPFDDLIAKLSAGGWRQVELGFRFTPETAWFSDIPKARALLEDNGIAVPSIHISPAGWNLADPDDTVRRTALAEALDCLEPAAALGAQVVVCHHNAPGENGFTEEDRDASMDRAREGLKTLAHQAESIGLRLAVENLPCRHTPRPGGPIDDVLDIVCDLGSHVGICVDTGHTNANGQDPAAEIETAANRLMAVHIQDNDGLGADQHLLPGAGTVDWERFRKALDRLAPDCIRTFEVAAKEGDPDDLAAELVDLRKAWSGA